MDDDVVLMAIGRLQGQVEGLGREIKTLTTAVDSGIMVMQQRHESLCGRVQDLELNGAKISRQNAMDIIVISEKLDCLEEKFSSTEAVDAAKTHWIDSIYAKIGLVITAAISLVSFLKQL